MHAVNMLFDYTYLPKVNICKNILQLYKKTFSISELVLTSSVAIKIFILVREKIVNK